MVAAPTLRAAQPSDAVDGVLPQHVTEPATREELAAALAWASQQRLQTVIRGGGSKLRWGRVPERVDLLVSTARLGRILAHRYADLTATIEAGAPLASVNAELGRRGQWLPVESAFAEATVGGIVATNDAGPLRHRYGTPRDLVIGMTMALADGRIVKSGGTVVKNVAGYDIGRFMSGSFGTLAAIVDVTFKLLPRPAASSTLVVEYPEPGPLVQAVTAIAASQLEPAAFDIAGASGPGATRLRLLVRFATSPAATEAQLRAARELAGGVSSVVTGDAEARLWDDHLRRPWASSAVVRVSWSPASLPEVLALVGEVQRAGGGTVTLSGRAGVGTGLFGIDADARGQVAAIERLRASGAAAHVVVLGASAEVKRNVDVWGAPLGAMPVLRALKQMFDPMGILNAGRGPI
jgi:glycolate oxidase FAD binding subunit